MTISTPAWPPCTPSVTNPDRHRRRRPRPTKLGWGGCGRPPVRAHRPAELGPNGPWPRPTSVGCSRRRPADTRHARPNWQQRGCAGWIRRRWERRARRRCHRHATRPSWRATPDSGVPQQSPLRRLTSIRDGTGLAAATTSPTRPGPHHGSADGAPLSLPDNKMPLGRPSGKR